MRSSSEEGSYLRLVDFCITQLSAESNDKEEEKKTPDATVYPGVRATADPATVGRVLSRLIDYVSLHMFLIGVHLLTSSYQRFNLIPTLIVVVGF